MELAAGRKLKLQNPCQLFYMFKIRSYKILMKTEPEVLIEKTVNVYYTQSLTL
jgi:hypothetical protein